MQIEATRLHLYRATPKVDARTPRRAVRPLSAHRTQSPAAYAVQRILGAIGSVSWTDTVPVVTMTPHQDSTEQSVFSVFLSVCRSLCTGEHSTTNQNLGA